MFYDFELNIKHLVDGTIVTNKFPYYICYPNCPSNHYHQLESFHLTCTPINTNFLLQISQNNKSGDSLTLLVPNDDISFYIDVIRMTFKKYRNKISIALFFIYFIIFCFFNFANLIFPLVFTSLIPNLNKFVKLVKYSRH